MNEPLFDDLGRPEPPPSAGEAETLLGFLDFQRATFDWKTSGLDDEQLQRRLEPSTMTLGGMLHHLSFVEDFWVSCVVAEQPPGAPWSSAPWETDPDWDWTAARNLTGDQLRRRWVGSVQASNELLRDVIAADPHALDDTHPKSDNESFSLRWILVHLVEEYARHNGHADLLRESIDGQRGE